MWGHREPRSSVSDTTSTPEAPPSFTNVKNGRASVTGYAVHKITGLTGEMAQRAVWIARVSMCVPVHQP